MELIFVSLWLSDGAIYENRGGVTTVIFVGKCHFSKSNVYVYIIWKIIYTYVYMNIYLYIHTHIPIYIVLHKR